MFFLLKLGFTISSSFGGLTATISGSGSATGSAVFKAGYSTSVTLGAKVRKVDSHA